MFKMFIKAIVCLSLVGAVQAENSIRIRTNMSDKDFYVIVAENQLSKNHDNRVVALKVLKEEKLYGKSQLSYLAKSDNLLVPKAIVSYSKKYTPEYYLQHFVLNFLQNEHLRLNSSLVQTKRLKDGTEKKFVTKKSIRENKSWCRTQH